MVETNSINPHEGKNNEREVTDPVTHLPIIIHDNTSVELEHIPPHPSREKDPESQKPDGEEGSRQRHATMEALVVEETHRGRWETPGGAESKVKVQSAMIAAGSAGIGGTGGLIFLWIWSKLFNGLSFGWFELFFGIMGCIILAIGVGACVIVYDRFDIFHNPTPHEDERIIEKQSAKKEPPKARGEDAPESATWLNSLLHSLWPIVNPTLFISIADMLEDALQATLPALIHGVRVADIGQGSEPMRILGIRWLDAGEAAEERDGMKAEEGDFVNMEVAVSYRARTTKGSGLRGRSGNAHLLTEFLVAGGMVLPVWVELTGMLATARMRIQLTPNPPFFSILTLTLLGQPKVTMICTPLAKNFLNIMDIPGLSGWLQRSVDAAIAEYVAPRSLNLDLKTLLMGREKMDTDALGVVVITVRSAKDFREGDAGNPLKSKDDKRGDGYVTAGWSKWGKPLWSTRIIKSDGNPIWEETTGLLVGPPEVNAQEKLRLQLWDCDRLTADDLLGTVDVPLKQLMHSPDTRNRIAIREDGFSDTNGSPCPGTLSWECGYFSKTTLEQHLEHRHQNVDEIKDRIEAEAEEKLREAKARNDETEEIEQQKKEDLKEKSDEIIASTKPTQEWPSGILSLRIEQINGLEVQKIKQSGVKEGGEDEESDDLPSAYCTVIINHQRVYKTRTKLKSNKPFFDAGTEKFIRDWQNTTVIIAVRDARMHEIDPLLGVVVLPLHTLFKHCSHTTDSFPLVGGIGYGRMRLSLTFRSVQALLPKRLLGWDVGTLDIQPYVRPSLDLAADFASCKLTFRTVYGKGKMASHQDGGWKQKRDKPVRLAVNKRYASCLLIEFRKHAFGPDKTVAFSTLWLKDLPDNEEVGVSLPVYKNEDGSLERARANSTNDGGEMMGMIDVKVRFWPGLSGYHQNSADQDTNMADVMEVLDCAEETKETTQEWLTDDESDSDESVGSHRSSSSSSSASLSDMVGDGTRGLVNGFADFKKKKGELHRKHRGLMQWRAARNVAWMGRGIENTAHQLGHRVTGAFKHQDRDTGIEKEV
ncbi:hypothetical protein BDZ94DRAFT_166478 [Collybia nuda]|uniref:Meiotically up-regulated gene 190 protein n=1 Tax=Collybia nuda TaxID=64659 RepID=A0A9P5XU88_9AGAR|nr:hypothetical protein BDZ94DRAFT_166478 [Collybia nuda]